MTRRTSAVCVLVLRVLAVALLSIPLFADDLSFRTLQSGSPTGPTPVTDRGVRGDGQIIAVLDTGLDIDSCFFHDKIAAYDVLWGEVGDDQGHGTHAAGAAAGDRGARGFHDSGDGLAPGAKLVVQDAGYSGGDNCAQRPGLGCPVRDLRPLLQQAYDHGARIHSNSWGDRQGVPAPLIPPTANYNEGAAQIDDFVYSHPDMLVIFNTGNAGTLGASSISAPGTAKNGIQVGGTRSQAWLSDDVLSFFSGRGPTRDGRMKPDLVGPAHVVAGDSDFSTNTNNCTTSLQPGTSWAAPTIAGAAALVRQYYAEGFYPTGSRRASDRIASPTAALVKATLIAAARPVGWREEGGDFARIDPVPSLEQGFGFPVLDDALYFAGDERKLRVLEGGLGQGETVAIRLRVPKGGSLKAVLVWTDPPGSPRGPIDPSPVLVNDLDLSLSTLPGRAPDRLNNVEVISFDSAAGGEVTVLVRAHRIAQGGRQSFALAMVGSLEPALRTRPARR